MAPSTVVAQVAETLPVMAFHTFLDLHHELALLVCLIPVNSSSRLLQAVHSLSPGSPASRLVEAPTVVVQLAGINPTIVAV